MAKKPVYLTPKGLEKIKDQLTYLTTTRRQELIEYMGSAIEDGDLRESAAYDEARLLQSENEARIADLEEILHRAIVIEPKEGEQAIVRLGAHVQIQDKKSEEIYNFQLVGTHEADFLNNLISDESPLGEKLMGCKANDSVKLNIGKKNVTYDVLSVTFE